MTAQGNSPDGNGQDQPVSESGQAGELASEWGRVDADGTVYVRTADGERAVGQYPEGTPEEALAFFTRRFDALAFEVQLLEQRVRAGALSPDEATESIKQVSAQLVEPQRGRRRRRADAPGSTRSGPLIGVQRGQRRADRARKLEEAQHPQGRRSSPRPRRSRRARTGATASTGCATCSRSGSRSRAWNASATTSCGTGSPSARTSYTRRRKAHFAELGEKREGARVIKERLLKEAEELSTSTDWGPTSSRYRTLMQEWKAAGAAPREVEEDLWQRFRAAQDTFFGARDAANAEQDREFAANAEKKKEILVEAEALLPVTDLEAAKRAFRDIAERWDAAGKVPRDQMKSLEGRIRKVEQAIRSVEDDQWRRSDPEKSARADDMLGQLERAIADIEANLEKARASGDQKKVRSSRRTSPRASSSSRWPEGASTSLTADGSSSHHSPTTPSSPPPHPLASAPAGLSA